MKDERLYIQLKKIVLIVSSQKKEPVWVRDIRLGALKKFMVLPIPKFLVPLLKLDLGDLKYYLKPEINLADFTKKRT